MSEKKPKYQDEEWLRERYWEEQKSMQEIADQVEVSTSTILRWFKRNSIETRSRTIANKGPHKTHREHVEELEGRPIEPIEQYQGRMKKIKYHCLECDHEWKNTPNQIINDQNGCPKCAGNIRLTTQEFKERVRNLVGDKYLVLGEYENNKTKIKMQHNIDSCQHKYKVRPDCFLHQGHRCPKCFRDDKRTTKEFKEKVNELVGKEYKVLGEYKTNGAPIMMQHNTENCQHKYEVSPHHFLHRGHRCPKCFGNARKTTKKFKDEVKELVGNEYLILGEYKNATTKILIQHNTEDCQHKFRMKPYNFLSGVRCPKCAKFKRESKGERKIANIFDHSNLNYQKEYKFNDCRNERPLPFDFAIFDDNDKIRQLIEYHGRQHYKPIKVFGGQKKFEQQQQHDQIKENYCKENDIPLTVIPYTEKDNIEEILSEELEEVI